MQDGDGRVRQTHGGSFLTSVSDSDGMQGEATSGAARFTSSANPEQRGAAVKLHVVTSED